MSGFYEPKSRDLDPLGEFAHVHNIVIFRLSGTAFSAATVRAEHCIIIET